MSLTVYLTLSLLVTCSARSSISSLRTIDDKNAETTFRRFLFNSGDKGGGGGTDPPQEGCPDKRVYITHVCDLVDLEPSRSDIDIRIALNSNLFWPQNIDVDCNGEGSDFVNSCRVPKNQIVQGNCFELTKSPSRLFRNLDTAPDLRVRITDVDDFFNDNREVRIRAEDWYNVNDCTLQSYESPKLNNDGSPVDVWIKYTVDSTGSATLPPPTPPPSRPSPAPSSAPTRCTDGIAESDILDGIASMETEIGAFTGVLRDFTNDGRRDRLLLYQGNHSTDLSRSLPLEDEDRELLWPALAAGAVRFGSLFAKASGPLSFVADAVGLGTDLFGLFGGDDEPSGPDPETLALFEQVFERFDAIDSKLESIEQQLQDGFEAIQDAIALDTAESIVREANNKLNSIQGAYDAYIVSRGAEGNAEYEESLRDICLDPINSAFTVFSQLQGLTSPGGDDALTSAFIAEAKSKSSTSVNTRIQWFRSNFSAMIMNMMIKAMYLYSSCLLPGCPNTNPVRKDRLDTMRVGLEESANYLSSLESQLSGLCPIKKIKVTRICNLAPALDTGIGENDGRLEVQVKTGSNVYWPADINRDCTSGNEQGGCSMRVRDVTGPEGQTTKCVAANRAATRTFTNSQTLSWTVVELDDRSFDDRINIELPGSRWYRSDNLCNTITLAASGKNAFDEYATLQFQVTSSD